MRDERRKFYDKNEKAALAALKKQSEAVAKAAAESEAAALAAIDATEEEIAEAYSRIYTATALYFMAQMWSRYVKKPKPSDKWRKRVVKHITSRGMKARVKDVQASTKRMVKATLKEAAKTPIINAAGEQIGTGLAPEKVASLIRKRWNEKDGINMTRARRIARTETVSAQNWASLEGAKAVQEEGIELVRRWIATNDPPRVRDDHLAAHGQVVGLDEPYYVGGEELDYPGDWMNGSPENTINCRCAEAFDPV